MMSTTDERRPATSNGRRAVFVIGMMLIPLVVVTAAVEIALRIRLEHRVAAVREMAGYFDTLFRWDPEIGAVHSPNVEVTLTWPEAPGGHITLRTNDRGFREDEDVSPASLVPRVIVFGDSHTDGFLDNADSFVNVAEHMLLEEGTRIELLNAGTSTQSLYAQYLMFRRHLDLAPDAVVFAFYTGNDFEEIIAPDHAHIAFDAPGTSGAGQPQERPAGPTSRLPDVYTRLEALIREQNPGPLLLLDWLRARFGPQTPRELIPREESVPIFAQGLSQAVRFNRSPAQFEAAARANDYVVGEIDRLARERGVSVSFVIIPTRRQVEREADAERFALVEQAYGLGPEAVVDERIRAQVRSSLEARGIAYLDPHDAFSSHWSETREALYYQVDHHLGPAGHRELGRLLADHLRPAWSTPAANE